MGRTARRIGRGLGWFSVGLGALELLAARALGRRLGLERRAGLLRLYGVRELASGAAIFATDASAAVLWTRVAGDALDLASLAPALRRTHPRRRNAVFAFLNVAGVACLDAWAASRA